MPEGHTIHRLAGECRDRFGGRPVHADSPQGKFSDGAALVDGAVLTEATAHGKHLFLGFSRAETVHIHLGLYGTFKFGTGPLPPPVGQIRLRLVGPQREGADQPEVEYGELRGPTRCELLTPEETEAVRARLGPDPLRDDAAPEVAWRRISRSRTTVAALLMEQSTVAGVGNVYRAEVLFRHGIDPYLPGRALTREEFDAVWADLAALMRDGVRSGRIDTVRPEHTPEAMGRPPRVDDHGGEVYVYRRAGQPCLLCGTEVRTAQLAARNLFWCPRCQPASQRG
ncbi:Fpg/Nei family DNA glycosylase [Streptomyces sulphureus]|uniref:Fpg/Nei family DNA glycosylase n=1 Tax=Streptomyces sulphureus TaxID=47758 RepID=UPI000367EAEC|nr:DNA-formamidopyrimidine glycosylase family protein [Streptomyces sulphureus]